MHTPLSQEESVHYRNRLRAARYAALADAEGFAEICFALEALGLRLNGKRGSLKEYRDKIGCLAVSSVAMDVLQANQWLYGRSFTVLFEQVREARNDAMHIGAYARNVTRAAIDLCIFLEEALMAKQVESVGNLMVSAPVKVERWQPVAYARQLMLTHSFTFLPVWIDPDWYLVSDLAVATYMRRNENGKPGALGKSIQDAFEDGLSLRKVCRSELLTTNSEVVSLVQGLGESQSTPLWLVVDPQHKDRLVGVLSPFELL